MRSYTVLAALVLVLMVSAAWAQSVSLTGPKRSGMLEDDTYMISWTADGIKSVSLVTHGVRTPVGGESRGYFHEAIAEGVPADREKVAWKVPWIDSRSLFIKAKGYDAGGRMVAIDERGYSFRPRTLANRTADGLYLDLHSRSNQRLYRQENYKITHVYVSSSSENYLWRAPGRHVKRPHDHAGVFSVLEKKRNHYSRLYEVDMPWAMRYHGGHFIHATSPNLYDELGRPASHGCNRLTWADAREIYRMTPVGTRVVVIGPDG